MEKLVLKNGREIILQEGYRLSSMSFHVDGYTELELISNDLTTENLSSIEFKTNDNVTGVYTNMAMASPRFKIENHEDGLLVTIGLREKTPEEIKIGSLEQQVTDNQMALIELYETLEN